MKKKTLLHSTLVIALVCLLFFSCKKKTYDDALPQVTIVSATVNGLDQVLLVGKITSPGVGNMDYTGFSFSTNPNFTLLSNQTLLNGTSGQFQAVVSASHDSTYYFRAFAANNFGYAQSSVIKYTVPTPAPVYAPCSLTSNYVNDNGSNFSVNSYGSSTGAVWGGYSVFMDGTNEDIAVSFLTAPINGTYTTVADGSTLGPGQACVSITNFNQYTTNNGGTVYVAVSGTTTTVSFCSLVYNNGSFNATISGEASY